MSNRNIPGLDNAVMTESTKNQIAENLRGNLFQSSYIFRDVAATSSVDLLVSNGTKNIMIVVELLSEYATLIEPFRNSTVSANGTSVNAVCVNGVLDNTPTTSIFRGPTVDSDGDAVPPKLVFGGGKQNAAIAGKGSPIRDYILPHDSDHILRLTNEDSSNAGDIFCQFTWMEVDQWT